MAVNVAFTLLCGRCWAGVVHNPNIKLSLDAESKDTVYDLATVTATWPTLPILVNLNWPGRRVPPQS